MIVDANHHEIYNKSKGMIFLEAQILDIGHKKVYRIGLWLTRLTFEEVINWMEMRIKVLEHAYLIIKINKTLCHVVSVI